MKRSHSWEGQSLVEFGLVAGIVAIIVVASLWIWARSAAGSSYQERAANSTQNETMFYDDMTSAAGDTHLD